MRYISNSANSVRNEDERRNRFRSRTGSPARARSTNGSRLIAALAVGALSLLGAAPAFAETPAGEAPSATQTPSATTPPVTPSPAPTATQEPSPQPKSTPSTPPTSAAPTDPAPQPSESGPAPTTAESGSETGVEQEPAAAPALRWRAVDAGGAPVPGSSFAVQGPAVTDPAVHGEARWADAPTVKIADNAELDHNTTDGGFELTELTQDGSPVTADETYRVRPVAGPKGTALGADAKWQELTGEVPQADDSATDVTLAPVEKAEAPAPSASAEGPTITPFASATTMTVTVRARAFAQPSSVGGSVSSNIGTNYANTVGTRYVLYENTNNQPGAATSYECTITSGGECSIDIPNANTTNQGKRYWVVQAGAAPGTYINNVLYLGDYNGPTGQRRLVGLTQTVGPNKTIYMPMTASGVSGGTAITSGELPSTQTQSVADAGSFGALTSSVADPVLNPKCDVISPLKIGIVIDQSASITAAQWTTLRTALTNGNDSVLGILRNANARVSILGFGTDASTGGNGWLHGGSGPAVLPANYANLIPVNRPGGSSNATNWDAGLSAMEAANATAQYDMVLFVTDGAPNYVLTNSQVNSYNVTLRSLEAPIFAANAIKNMGTRVVTIGVGNGASGANIANNLRAVSGANAGSDFFQGDWDELTSMLTDVVKTATCTVPIEVSKTTIGANGASTLNAGNWTFGATKQSGDGTLSGAASQTTTAGTAGTAKWSLAFTQPTGQSASIRLAEDLTGKVDWSLTQVSCTIDGQAVPTTVSNNGVVLSGITPSSGKVSCVFTNTQAQFGTLAITKALSGSDAQNFGASLAFSGTYTCTAGGQTVASGTWSRTGAGAATLTPAAGTPAVNKLPVGATCSATETPPTGGLPNSSWRWATPSVSAAQTITNGGTATITVTNTVERVYANFSVTKQLESGSTADSGLSFSGIWSCTLGSETVQGNWGPIPVGGTWTSTAAAKIPLGASCKVTAEQLSTWPVASDHSIQWGEPTLGATVTAAQPYPPVVTVINRTKTVLGSVFWSKVSAGGSHDLLAGSEWRLTGPGQPAGGTVIVDCAAAPCPAGGDQDPAAGKFTLTSLKWGNYTLVETKAPPGYVLDATPHTFTISDATLTVNVGPLSNAQQPGVALPLTGGIGSDQVRLWGTLIALLAALGGALYWRRIARQSEVG